MQFTRTDLARTLPSEEENESMAVLDTGFKQSEVVFLNPYLRPDLEERVTQLSEVLADAMPYRHRVATVVGLTMMTHLPSSAL